MNAALTVYDLGEQPRLNGAAFFAYPNHQTLSHTNMVDLSYPAIPFSNNPASVHKNPAWRNYKPDIQHTINHGINVAVVAIQIGARMGLSARQLSYLFVTGILHDVSKFEQDPNLLFKASKLTVEEHNNIKPHAERSATLVMSMTVDDINDYIVKGNKTGRIDLPLFDRNDIDVPRRVAKIICQHHEHFDGSGYPRGLQGENILLLARIVTAADVFCARIEEGRNYEKRISPHQAIDYMQGEAKAEFDPKVLIELRDYVITAYPLRTMTDKNDGSVAIREKTEPTLQPQIRHIQSPIPIHGLH